MKAASIAVVTGAAGFIGSHMVDLLLDQGYRVHAIDNLSSGRLENLDHRKSDPNLVFEVRELTKMDPNDHLFEGASFVFHFAGIGDIVPSIERPVDYMSGNVMGTVHALEALRRSRYKFPGRQKIIGPWGSG